MNLETTFNAGDEYDPAYADHNGYYKITPLAPGHYIVREVRQSGWNRTAPVGAWPAGYYSVTLAANHVYECNDFGNLPIR